MLYLFSFLAYTLFIGVSSAPCDNKHACDWTNWKAWSGCSRTCGGGSRSRFRAMCCDTKYDFSECPKNCGVAVLHQYDREQCGDICSNGGVLTGSDNRYCTCSDINYGYCCENGCRHIPIAHCISGRQQCGGSPDGIKCTECVDPYYSAGYNNGCKECPPITQCEYRHCTSAYNTICKSCYEDRTIFKRTHSDTQCERMCAFNNHYCWPGTCSTNGLTKDCRCAPGFKKVSRDGADMSGETSCQPDTRPSIETCDTVFVGTNGEQKRTESSGSSTECKALQDTWGNYQPFRIQFNMASHFEVDITAYTSPRPSFIKEETFGISDTTVYVKRKPISGSENILSTHYQKKDSNSSQNVQTTVYNAGNLTVSSSTYDISNGEALCISYEAKGGGYLKSIDTRASPHIVSNPVPYTKVTEARQLCFRYDNAPPEHCLKLGNCITEPLVLESRITRSAISEITFSGWTDPIPPGGYTQNASSIESYSIIVNKVMPSKVLQKVDTAIVFQKRVTSSVHNMTVNLTSDTPMMFSIMLEVKDVADNVRQTRHFLLYDNSTFIETRTDKPFFVSSASTQSNFTWQTHHHEICLYWVDHFYNKFYLDNAILNPVEPDPNGLISGLYEQNNGLLPVQGTPNIAGIIKYEISWALNDNPYSSEFDVPDFLNQNFCLRFDLKDGQRYTFNVKPVDIAGNTYHENRTVYIDRSHPHINNIWLKKDDYKVSLLFVHDRKDLSKMQMTFDALDQHSGLLMIKWEFGIADTSTKLISESLAVNRLSNISCPADSRNCYCPDIGACEIYSYTIPLNKLNVLDRQTGDHNRTYYFTIVVTNNALLTNTEHVDILLDDSPSEVGGVYEGRTVTDPPKDSVLETVGAVSGSVGASVVLVAVVAVILVIRHKQGLANKSRERQTSTYTDIAITEDVSNIYDTIRTNGVDETNTDTINIYESNNMFADLSQNENLQNSHDSLETVNQTDVTYVNTMVTNPIKTT